MHAHPHPSNSPEFSEISCGFLDFFQYRMLVPPSSEDSESAPEILCQIRFMTSSAQQLYFSPPSHPIWHSLLTQEMLGCCSGYSVFLLEAKFPMYIEKYSQ